MGIECASVLLTCLLAQSNAPPADLASLLKGVHTIAAPGVPGSLCVFGPRAWVVVAGGAGDGLRAPVAAAAEWGNGRVVALGHNGYFGEEALATADTGAFMENCVRWAARRGRKAPRVGVGGWERLPAWLGKQGFAVMEMKREAWRKEMGETDLIVLAPDWLDDREGVAEAARYVQGGGGLLIGEPGWGWQQLNAKKHLRTDFAGNRLLAPAGIVWTEATLERTADKGYDAAAPPELCHAGRALQFLIEAKGQRKEDLRQASYAITEALHAIPEDDSLLRPKLAAAARAHPPAVPTSHHPLKAESAMERVLLSLDLEKLWSLPPAQMRAHAAANEFPGEVPAGAPRVTRQVDIGPQPGWHSTGLYAVAGEAITVSLAGSVTGLRCRIGAHTDPLWALDSWSRVPEVSRDWPLESATITVASPFGGLIYIEVPDGSDSPATTVRIGGAVEAPLFVQGKTTPAEWKEVRARPAPWAELATEKVILTVPSTSVRTLEDPGAVMAFWDRVLDAEADLATIPRARRRPERIVTDVEISAGYMHSGYPIMTHLDVARRIVDPEALKKDGWGFWHELGHNHQVGDWTFEGTGEVTNNVFTVYVCETVCGQAEGHGDIAPAHRKEARARYLAGGAKFEEWKKDPFLALDMYLQLKEAFGWDAYKKVFAEYRGLPKEQRPKDDAEKRDQWMVRFSRAVGNNLGPFFQAWGVPTSERARRSIESLPAWMPERFPE